MLSLVQATVRAALELEHAREADKLRRDRAHLERQSRALAKIPTRKDRAEIEALEAVVEQARKDSKAKDARHKLTIERLRRQIVTLQARCCAPLNRAARCFLQAVLSAGGAMPVCFLAGVLLTAVAFDLARAA